MGGVYKQVTDANSVLGTQQRLSSKAVRLWQSRYPARSSTFWWVLQLTPHAVQLWLDNFFAPKPVNTTIAVAVCLSSLQIVRALILPACTQQCAITNFSTSSSLSKTF